MLHLTHYDPAWYRRKSQENPIDLGLALEIIDSIARAGFNLLIIDCADAVRYGSHPELRRRYSVSQAHLKKLVMRAKANGIEAVPKLNFSRSEYHKHNFWFRPYNKLFDSQQYWQIAFELIDELIRICQPKHFFHVGMDEDRDRGSSQYIKAILRLRHGLKQRGLRTLIWNDSSHKGFALTHARKSIAAEKRIPKDIVQIIWDYHRVPFRHIRRLINQGFEVWGAPGWDSQHAYNWKQAILRCGGTGLVMTRWIPCCRRNRAELLRLIGTAGPVYSSRYMKSA